jgi:hypothetical protein
LGEVERWTLQDAQLHFGAIEKASKVGMKVLPGWALRDAIQFIPTQIQGTTRQKWV